MKAKFPRPSYPLQCSLLIMISPGWNPWGRNGDANRLVDTAGEGAGG